MLVYYIFYHNTRLDCRKEFRENDERSYLQPLQVLRKGCKERQSLPIRCNEVTYIGRRTDSTTVTRKEGVLGV